MRHGFNACPPCGNTTLNIGQKGHLMTVSTTVRITSRAKVPVWGISVDDVEHCARIAALRLSHLKIKAFASTSLGVKLPAELFVAIEKETYRAIVLEERVTWLNLRKCCQSSCDMRTFHCPNPAGCEQLKLRQADLDLKGDEIEDIKAALRN